MSRGIDYSDGTANFDRETGIHYGVISIHDLNEWAWEGFEPDYGNPSCPKCENDVVDSHGIENDMFIDASRDYYCHQCNESFWSDACYGDEAISHNLDDGEYVATLDSYNDIFILKSPYYTLAGYCSPCAPGAGHLSNPCEDGVKTYCFGPDWFSKESPCHYPVYSVADDSLVYSPPANDMGENEAGE